MGLLLLGKVQPAQILRGRAGQLTDRDADTHPEFIYVQVDNGNMQFGVVRKAMWVCSKASGFVKTG